ncbi:hypothetical protein [Streptomyces brevispora]|uniref:Uncharacterized protein n=1 Tax=Streptomyces brevispora TaxID=887462 RepID=A0ABZ1G1T3_9ACTN|nr:hypothetical protein [Streptomyces brevispora]WSC13839.1 hypothetical protein OIE64_13960 [Streptomyces brevispora]
MDTIDFGDMSDLGIRLRMLAEESDRRLVTVFGSGISNAVLPSVGELTEIFRKAVPPAGQAKFERTVDSISDPAQVPERGRPPDVPGRRGEGGACDPVRRSARMFRCGAARSGRSRRRRGQMP